MSKKLVLGFFKLKLKFLNTIKERFLLKIYFFKQQQQVGQQHFEQQSFQRTAATNSPLTLMAGPPMMGTITQAFQGPIHPIIVPGLGIIGYGNAPSPPGTKK